MQKAWPVAYISLAVLLAVADAWSITTVFREMRSYKDAVTSAASNLSFSRQPCDTRKSDEGTKCVKRCTQLSQFSPTAAAGSSGLLLPRSLAHQQHSLDLLDVQNCVEQVARRLLLASEEERSDVLFGASIPIAPGQQAEIDAPTMSQIETTLHADFPPALVGVILDDITALCTQMVVLVEGQCNSLDVKLELIGENSCKLWHYDNFVGRSIVTYSGLCGTTFCDDPTRTLKNVREMENVPSAESAQALQAHMMLRAAHAHCAPKIQTNA